MRTTGLIACAPALASAARFRNIQFNREVQLPKGPGSLIVQETYEITAVCDDLECRAYELDFSGYPPVSWTDAKEKGLVDAKRGDTVNLTIRAIVDRASHPQPASLPQGRFQWLNTTLPFQPPTSHPTDSSTLIVNLCDGEQHPPVVFPPNHSSISPKAITYSDVTARRDDTFSVHAFCSKPGIRIPRLDKTVTLSQVLNKAYVKEEVWAQNQAARLSGEFSLVTHEVLPVLGRDAVHFKKFDVALPPGAQDFYVTDEIGYNWGTQSKDGIKEVYPRFALYGGWKYNWVHGFNQDLSDLQSTTGAKTVAQVKLLDTIRADQYPIAVDQYSLRVILPPGSRNVRVVSGSDFLVGIEKTFSYGDFSGRSTVLFRLNPVILGREVGNAQSTVEIEYELPGWHFMNLAILPVICISVIFLIVVVRRIDFSISLSQQEFNELLRTEPLKLS